MWGYVFSVYPFALWWLREYIYFVLLSSSNRKYELLPIVYKRVKSWNNGMRCMSFYILMIISFGISKLLIVEQNPGYQVKCRRKSIDSACTLPQVTPIEFGPKQKWPGIPDKKRNDPMTSRHGNAFRIIGSLWGTHRWMMGSPSQRVSNAQLWCFLWCWQEQAVKQPLDLPVIWDAVTLMQRYFNIAKMRSNRFMIFQNWLCRLCVCVCVWERVCFSMKNTHWNLDTLLIKN